ncbi:MAG: hypothetical protein WC677_05855 [Clostridia bacterium]
MGKGQGNRAFDHLNDKSESEKCKKIDEILKSGQKPKIEIVVHGINEITATKVEAAIIDTIGLKKLTNVKHGHGHSLYGRLSTHEIIQRFNAEPANISEPAVLLRIGNYFRRDMTPIELYDLTRGIWRMSENGPMRKTEYAFAVYDGVIIEVYKIKQWFIAGTTFTTRQLTKKKDRWEFVGNVAEPEIRKKYINKMVDFKKGSQNPINFINV